MQPEFSVTEEPIITEFLDPIIDIISGHKRKVAKGKYVNYNCAIKIGGIQTTMIEYINTIDTNKTAYFASEIAYTLWFDHIEQCMDSHYQLFTLDKKCKSEYDFHGELKKLETKYDFTISNELFSRIGVSDMLRKYIKTFDTKIMSPLVMYQSFTSFYDDLIKYLEYLMTIRKKFKKTFSKIIPKYTLHFPELYFICVNAKDTYKKYKTSTAKIEIFNIFDEFSVIECKQCHIACVNEKKKSIQAIICDKCCLLNEIDNVVKLMNEQLLINSNKMHQLKILFVHIFAKESDYYLRILFKKNITNTLERILSKHATSQRQIGKLLSGNEKKKFIKDTYYKYIYLIKELQDIVIKMYDSKIIEFNSKFLLLNNELYERFELIYTPSNYHEWTQYMYLIEKTLVDPVLSPYDILETFKLFPNSTNTCCVCSVKIFLIEMPCCHEELCGSCIDKIIQFSPKGIINLYPQCPFCRAVIDVAVFNIDYAKMYAKYRLQVTHPASTHYYSMCTKCPTLIETEKRCALRETDLPELCMNCCYAGTKRCPGCTICIERVAGCNNVTCALCKTSMCWLCGEKVQNHDRNHFIHGYFGNMCKNKNS
jgi:hypothetical protein